MEYGTIREGRFLARPNRFIAQVELDGETVVAHVKNTGRCRELLLPGAPVYLEHSPKPGRKTAYSLVAVRKGECLINMDSQAPNKLAEEALRGGWVPQGVPGPAGDIRREVRWGDSRLDFQFVAGGRPVYLEVKGVTLEEDGVGLFPDAPTERGIRHLEELGRAVEAGMGACVLFVVQLRGVRVLRPNDRTQPAFGEALRQARDAGVLVCARDCLVEPGRVTLYQPVPVEL